MKDLKIRVATEAENKEAQELFFELGAKWRSQINREEAAYVINTEYPSIILHGGDMSLNWNTIEQFNSLSYYKEITLQELRDMVNPMKEYLEPSNNYSLIKAHRKEGNDWIEVPEGATHYAIDSNLGIKKNYFFRCPNDAVWVDYQWMKANFSVANQTVLWQRHTQPEELPFMDSLNNQYAEIEQVRQQVNSLPEFKHDFVNHPKHYCDHPSGIECIEITRHHDFAIGNAIKYLWRAGLKDSDNEIQDLKKAVWYIQDKIAQLENK